MADQSGIEWCDATWNPVTGCAKVSAGCKNCYAEREWGRLASIPGSVYEGRPFTDVRLHPERLRIPAKWQRPRRIFVNSMSDLFHDSLTDDDIARVFGAMARAPQHQFQVLTKRPERARDLMTRAAWGGMLARPDGAGEATEWALDPEAAVDAQRYGLPNVWFGVSVENQETADERLPILYQIPARVRWASVEPLLEVTRLPGLGDRCGWCNGPLQDDGGCPPCEWIWADCPLDWVVGGGESGPGARVTPVEALRLLRDECGSAGVPFNFKQHGEWIHEDLAPPAASYRERRGEYVRVGKKNAGRVLDGQTWDEYPVPA